MAALLAELGPPLINQRCADIVAHGIAQQLAHWPRAASESPEFGCQKIETSSSFDSCAVSLKVSTQNLD